MKERLLILKPENLKLHGNVSKMEVTLATNVGDLDQYSRRSCLRIADIEKKENEDTSELVHLIADRLNIDVHLMVLKSANELANCEEDRVLRSTLPTI